MYTFNQQLVYKSIHNYLLQSFRKHFLQLSFTNTSHTQHLTSPPS